MAKEGFVNIHGKEYKTVAKRVQEFREKTPDWSIMTEIVQLDAEMCVIKASILMPLGNGEGSVVATGHGCEFKSSSQINKTSYVENCETSAIGRALACLGFGGTEFASADEVANAIHQQNNAVKSSTIKATDGAFEKLSEEEKQFITDFAMEIVADIQEGHIDDAYGKLQSLDNEEKVAIWTKFDSKTRSTLTKHKDLLKGK